MKKQTRYNIGKKCIVCNEEAYPNANVFANRFFLLNNTSEVSWTFIRKGKEEILIGFTSKNEKFICARCTYLLVGLENEYDCFYWDLIEFEPAIKIIKSIISDKELLDKVCKIRCEGKFIPPELITKAVCIGACE